MDQIDNTGLFVICWVVQGSRPRCGRRHAIFHSNIFFYVKLFATIILSWNSLNGIIWYLLELSDPFIHIENSVLRILIEKNFEQKIYFCLLKMRSIFLKKGNPIFSIKLGQRLPKSFSQFHVRNSRFFLSYFVKKDERPKAYAGPRLPTLPYNEIIRTCVMAQYLGITIDNKLTFNRHTEIIWKKTTTRA